MSMQQDSDFPLGSLDQTQVVKLIEIIIKFIIKIDLICFKKFIIKVKSMFHLASKHFQNL